MRPKETPARLHIGAFARRTGLSRDTIRFYERQGLLAPQIEPNGYRTFDSGSVERATAIQIAQSLGFTLKEILRSIGEWEKDGLTAESRLRYITDKQAEVEARIAALQHMRNYLVEKAQWIQAGERGLPPSFTKPPAPKRKAAKRQAGAPVNVKNVRTIGTHRKEAMGRP
jgi:MerR family transcriptional regulator, copper efflux regulator